MSCNCVVCDSYSCIKIVPIFAHLNSDEMAQVASITSERTYEKGQTIYRVGESRGELYVLHSGSVKVYRLSADGKEQVLRRVQSGQFLGELSLFSNNKQTDNAVALETSQMCVIKWDNLRSLIEKIPSIAFKVMEELSNQSDSLLSIEITICDSNGTCCSCYFNKAISHNLSSLKNSLPQSTSLIKVSII
jgi:CRP-like cAMP-binding protein